MGKSKWFEPTSDGGVTLRPMMSERVTAEHLSVLFGEAESRKNLSAEVVKLLRTRASLLPRVRLMVNLKTLMTIMAEREIGDVLTDGLAPVERQALIELQTKSYPSEALIAAHGLLNIAERDVQLQLIRGLLFSVQRRGDAVLPEAGASTTSGAAEQA